MEASKTQVPLRKHFHEKLEEIQSGVIRMGGMAHEMVRLSVDAFLNGDMELAGRVIDQDDEVDALERKLLDQAVMTTMSEAPVARDLLMVVSTIGVVSEIEKVADHAVKLSRRARKLQRQFPPEMKVALLELGEGARRAFSASLRLFGAYADDLAQAVIDGDAVIDEKYTEARDRLMGLIRENPDQTEALVLSMEAFHALEHVADHAVAIAVRLKMVYGSGGEATSSALS